MPVSTDSTTLAEELQYTRQELETTRSQNVELRNNLNDIRNLLQHDVSRDSDDDDLRAAIIGIANIVGIPNPLAINWDSYYSALEEAYNEVEDLSNLLALALEAIGRQLGDVEDGADNDVIEHHSYLLDTLDDAGVDRWSVRNAFDEAI